MFIEKEETRWFNEYVGRLRTMLDGLSNDCSTFVYYGLEDAQAKTKPLYCSGWNDGDNLAQDSTERVTTALNENGFDYYFLDGEDLSEAVETLQENGLATISAHPVKTILIPRLDVMRESSLEHLAILEKAGIRVAFIDSVPMYAAESGELCALSSFRTVSVNEMLSVLYEDGGIFNEKVSDAIILRAKFQKGNTTTHMLVNKSRVDALLTYNSIFDAELWNPADGSVAPVHPGESVQIPAMRAVFVLYPQG